MSYRLPAGYRENAAPCYSDDDLDGVVFQPDVYRLAERLAVLTGADGLLDVGCGRAGKLAEIHDRHPGWIIEGLDLRGPNLDHCRSVYPWGDWTPVDLEHAPDLFAPSRVIVCADVIEHLVHPLDLLSSLRAALDDGACAVVLSTPDRLATRGPADLGPPANRAHVREWSFAEFVELLTDHRLAPSFAMLTRSAGNAYAAATTYVEVLP